MCRCHLAFCVTICCALIVSLTLYSSFQVWNHVLAIPCTVLQVHIIRPHWLCRDWSLFFFFSRWFLVLTFSTYLHPAEQRCCKYVVADWKGICLTCDGRSEHLCVCMYVCVRERVAWWLRSLAREIILNAKEFQGCAVTGRVLLSCAVCSRLTISTRLWIQKIS